MPVYVKSQEEIVNERSDTPNASFLCYNKSAETRKGASDFYYARKHTKPRRHRRNASRP